MYEKLQNIIEQQDSRVNGMPPNWLTALLSTTSTCLDFNDKYELTSHFGELESDLSNLALQIAQRLDIEDKMIAIYGAAGQPAQMSKIA